MACDALALHEAYKRGDLETLKRLLGDPPDFPNRRGPAGVGEIVLEYAIYHSPLAFIRALLEQGADPNYQDHAGFPALIATLSSDRADRYQIIELLLAAGADIQERGINDWTPLHYAAATDDLEAIDLLLAHGADPNARTRIDHCATPLEEAKHLGRAEAARSLRKWRRRAEVREAPYRPPPGRSSSHELDRSNGDAGSTVILCEIEAVPS